MSGLSVHISPFPAIFGRGGINVPPGASAMLLSEIHHEPPLGTETTVEEALSTWCAEAKVWRSRCSVFARIDGDEVEVDHREDLGPTIPNETYAGVLYFFEGNSDGERVPFALVRFDRPMIGTGGTIGPRFRVSVS